MSYTATIYELHRVSFPTMYTNVRAIGMCTMWTSSWIVCTVGQVFLSVFFCFSLEHVIQAKRHAPAQDVSLGLSVFLTFVSRKFVHWKQVQMRRDVAILIEALKSMKDVSADLALPHTSIGYCRNSFSVIYRGAYLAERQPGWISGVHILPYVGTSPYVLISKRALIRYFSDVDVRGQLWL